MSKTEGSFQGWYFSWFLKLLINMKQSMKGAEQNMSSAFHRQWLEDIVFYFPHLWVEKYNIDYNRMQYSCQLEYLIYSVAKLWSWEYSILFYFVHHSFIIPSVHHSYFSSVHMYCTHTVCKALSPDFPLFMLFFGWPSLCSLSHPCSHPFVLSLKMNLHQSSQVFTFTCRIG